MHPLISLLIGLALAALGGELFVKGLVNLAEWARLPASLIGATIAAFATSSPELAVSVSAAVAGTPQIALGDALGSNLVNIGLVLGLVLLLGGIKEEPGGGLRRDLPWAIAAPVTTALLLLDGELSRLEAGALLAMFLVWLSLAVRSALRSRTTEAPVVGRRSSIVFTVLGLACLVGCGGFIVEGAKWIGSSLGLSTFVTGATFVAIGTSMPELATSLVSRLRGHHELGLGTLLGSNLFNGLFIVSTAALIQPMAVRPQEVAAGLAFGALTVLAMTPGKSGELRRSRGWLLIGLYAASIVVLLIQ